MNAKTFLAAVMVAGAALVGASQASAMPVAPQSQGAGVDLVRFGCPPGYQPNRYGRCQHLTRRGMRMERRTWQRRHNRWERRHRW